MRTREAIIFSMQIMNSILQRKLKDENYQNTRYLNTAKGKEKNKAEKGKKKYLS